MTAARQNKPVEQFPERSGIGQPENIVPSPTPTPKPTDDFPTDFPTGGPGCLPGDVTCIDSGDDGGVIGNDDPFSDNNGNEVPLQNGSPAMAPATTRAACDDIPWPEVVKGDVIVIQ